MYSCMLGARTRVRKTWPYCNRDFLFFLFSKVKRLRFQNFPPSLSLPLSIYIYTHTFLCLFFQSSLLIITRKQPRLVFPPRLLRLSRFPPPPAILLNRLPLSFRKQRRRLAFEGRSKREESESATYFCFRSRKRDVGGIRV